jgi:hypothetical protein
LEDALRLAKIQILPEPMLTLGTSPTPAGRVHSREAKSAEVSDELSSFINPPRLEFSHAAYHLSSPPEATLRHHASASRTISITNNDFQALDPAVSLLAEELAWLDNTSTMTPHPEPAIDYDENFDFLQDLAGDGMNIDMDFGTAV